MAQVAINSVNDGAIIPGGTYANTADGKTTFKNSAGSGLWLQAGSNLRGVEVDSAGKFTNHGGTFHFYAPGQAVRLDGNIDVRGIRNGTGTYLGNGGKVFVDSAYLYQGGNIYAGGRNGGLVQFNVMGAEIASTGNIYAQGSGGQGGIISINASGLVHINRSATLNTSGTVTGAFDTNVINIEGSLVNIEGNLFANGMASRGGTIRLVATGQTALTQGGEAPLQDGDVLIAPESRSDFYTPPAYVSANGSVDGRIGSGNNATDPAPRAGDGGTIIITAKRDIHQGGLLQAFGGSDLYGKGASDLNGGHGGTITMTAGRQIDNTGRIEVDGRTGAIGGAGGLAAFSYGESMSNSGGIRAQGGLGRIKAGNGGLLVFSGSGNPVGNGVAGASAGIGAENGLSGSVVVPDPVSASNTLIGIWRKTQPTEMLTHAENIILLRNYELQPNPQEYPHHSLIGDSINAQFRSILDQEGQAPLTHGGQAESEFLSKISTNDEAPQGEYYYRNFIFSNQSNDQYEHLFFDPVRLTRGLVTQISTLPFNTMTVQSARSMELGIPSGSFDPTSYIKKDIAFGNETGGGHFSLIAPYVQQNQAIRMKGGIGGGSINIAITGEGLSSSTPGMLTSSADMQTGGPIHGGSVIIKANQRIRATSRETSLMANGDVMGGVQQLLSTGVIESLGKLTANGGLRGGIISIQAPQHILDYGIQANGVRYGGFIQLGSDSMVLNGPIEATGALQQGQIVIKPAQE